MTFVSFGVCVLKVEVERGWGPERGKEREGGGLIKFQIKHSAYFH